MRQSQRTQVVKVEGWPQRPLRVEHRGDLELPVGRACAEHVARDAGEERGVLGLGSEQVGMRRVAGGGAGDGWPGLGGDLPGAAGRRDGEVKRRDGGGDRGRGRRAWEIATPD